MGYSNTTWIPRLDRLLVLLFAFSSALLYLGLTGHNATRPSYPPGSLPPDARGGGAGSCRMTFMSPAYFHVSAFDGRETRLGNGPWGLYLYREAGWDEDPVQADGRGGERLALAGTPVLFVPGNAGSFKQVRSLASTATRMFWELPGVRRRGGGWDKEGSTSLDFFTLDFNDDFSAFHGQTLFDQAEYAADAIRYILGLYAGGNGNGPAPTSVIVVAHSMGGIVARAAFLDARYQTGSISTVLTFATPHLLPPVTVDSGVDKFYSSVNSYWRKAYSLSYPASNPYEASPRDELAEVVTISINGGLSDEMIASETASLSTILPDDDSNGFAVSTTAIPTVQTPIDHLAILWCQQLMQVVAESLLSIVDSRQPAKVTPRRDRIDVFGTKLLGGVERKDRVLERGRRLLGSIEQGEPSRQLSLGQRLSVPRKQDSTGGGGGRKTYTMPAPTAERPQRFSLLTSGEIGEDRDVEVYGCSTAPRAQAIALDDASRLSCLPLFPRHVAILPSSPHSETSPILPAAVGDETMNLISLEASDTHTFTHMVISVNSGLQEWVKAEFEEEENGVEVINFGALQLLLSGYNGRLPSTATASMISEISLEALDTSLLTLELRVKRSSCQETKTLFAPFVRQYSRGSLHESRYYPNVRKASLYTHSAGPYIPVSSATSSNPGVRLQFFVDPECLRTAQAGTFELEYEIRVDLLKTIGNLFVRYRMALVTIPFALVVLVVAIQLREYDAGHSFPSFDVALAVFARRYLPSLLLVLLVLGYLQTILSGRALLSPATSSPSFPWIGDALLGNPGSFWAPIFALLVMASLAVVFVEYLTLVVIVGGLSWLARTVSATSYLPIDPQATHLSATQRSVALAFLLLFTIFFAPCQFAYLVLFLIHTLTTVRLLASATTREHYASVQQGETQEDADDPPPSSTPLTDVWDQYHFSFSILFLLLCLLPLNALILIVWVRNLAVGWFAPFSSDHHILSILGFVAVVESLHSGGRLLRRSESSPLLSRITLSLAIFSASYSLLYGIRTAYRISTFGNVFTAWLALLTSKNRFLFGVESTKPRPTSEGPSRDGIERKVATTARTRD